MLQSTIGNYTYYSVLHILFYLMQKSWFFYLSRNMILKIQRWLQLLEYVIHGICQKNHTQHPRCLKYLGHKCVLMYEFKHSVKSDLIYLLVSGYLWKLQFLWHKFLCLRLRKFFIPQLVFFTIISSKHDVFVLNIN